MLNSLSSLICLTPITEVLKNMIEHEIFCSRCGKRIEDERWRCHCGGPLDIRTDLRGRDFWDSVTEREDIGRYEELIPVQFPDKKVKVGWTPTVYEKIDGIDVFFKLEYLNLGGSFKDRGAYISLVKVKEMGKGAIIDSSGNAGISFSLMGHIFNIPIHVFVPHQAPAGKKNLLKFLGADLHDITGSREEVNVKAINFESSTSTYVGHWWNPYFLEGTKTVAYEAFEQIGEVDYVLLPLGSGTLLLGMYKGYAELQEMGATKTMPRLIGVQAQGYGYDEPIIKKSKLADGIAIESPPRKDQIINAVMASKGMIITVTDEEIRASLLELRDSGFIVEPTSTVSYAALKRAGIPHGSRVLLPLTGSGLKVVDELAGLV